MKAHIGKYPHHHNTMKIEQWWLSFHHGFDYEFVTDEMHTPLDRAVLKLLDGVLWVLNHTINPFNRWRGQKVKVHVDPWDTWNADRTLALVILPVLEQLRDTAYGYPLVDPADVPTHLKPSKEELDHFHQTMETDGKAQDRWEWVLGEMIFAFEKVIDDSWELEFYHFGENMMDVQCIDREGLEQMSNRIDNGLALFGKYYMSLWD